MTPSLLPRILLSYISYTTHAHMAKDGTAHNGLSLFLHHLALKKMPKRPIWQGQFLNGGSLLPGLSIDNQDYYCNFLQYFSIFSVDLIVFPNEGRFFFTSFFLYFFCIGLFGVFCLVFFLTQYIHPGVRLNVSTSL